MNELPSETKRHRFVTPQSDLHIPVTYIFSLYIGSWKSVGQSCLW